ncbi:hypothetical protein D9M68_854570 [compost metagenome]
MANGFASVVVILVCCWIAACTPSSEAWPPDSRISSTRPRLELAMKLPIAACTSSASASSDGLSSCARHASGSVFLRFLISALSASSVNMRAALCVSWSP